MRGNIYMWEYQRTDELYHYGIPGMKWGHHKKYDTSMFTASNGRKVAMAKNGLIRGMRKVSSNRMVENAIANSYRNSINRTYRNTLTNRYNAAKGEMSIRKDAAALREYHAHQKDFRKGTGTKYLDKAVAKNRTYDTMEKVRTAMPKAFSDSTVRRAAKYVTKKNMTVNQAVKHAQNVAIAKKVAGLVALYGIQYAMKKG